MYERTIKLKENEIPAKVNKETGEITELQQNRKSYPEGTSKLKYNEFSIFNNETAKKLRPILSNEELGVIYYMIAVSEINTNSLAPLCEELSIRDKAKILNLNKNKVKHITDKLFKLGVYLSIKVYEDQEKVFWVLNPYISWRGSLVKDSIFLHFKDTMISKLLK